MGDIERVAAVLVEAERNRAAVGPVSDLVPGGLSLQVAHAVCEHNLQRRLAAGEHAGVFSTLGRVEKAFV